jgi:hypothetical protein
MRTEGQLKYRLRFDFDLESLQQLTDEEISSRFQSTLLPKMIERVREAGRYADDDDCPVCSPWCYSVF